MKKWEQKEIENLIPKYKKDYPHQNNFVEWNNTILFKWEFELLKYIDAIDDKAIKLNYPLLEIVKSNGDSVWKDYNGDIGLINQEIEKIKRDTRFSGNAKVSWCPRGYSLWAAIKSGYTVEEKKSYAENKNNPPLEVLDANDVLKELKF